MHSLVRHACLLIGGTATLLFLFSCNRQTLKVTRDTLEQAELVIQDNPARADSLLQAIDAEQLSESVYHYFLLLRVHAWDRTGVNIVLSDSLVCEAKNFFIKRHNAPRAAFACFVAARVCQTKGNLQAALQAYQAANEWAQKADYQIPYFSYYKIPYNIALLLASDQQYRESLPYVNIALSHLVNEHNSNKGHILYALELKLANFQGAGELDSLMDCYNKAITLTKQLHDLTSKSRINYNLSLMLYNLKNDYAAKEKCLQTLESTPLTDSINTGRLYTVLAAIYNRNHNIDSAYTTIYKAKSLLVKAEFATRQFLYETLITIENSKENLLKVAEHQKTLDEIIADHEKAMNSEAAILQAELQKQKMEQIGLTLTMVNRLYAAGKHRARNTNLLMAFAALAVVSGGALCYQTNHKRRWAKRKQKQVEEAEMIITNYSEDLKKYKGKVDYLQHVSKKKSLRYIFSRRDLIRLVEWIEENYEKNQFRKEVVGQLESLILGNHRWQIEDYYKALFDNLSVDHSTLTEEEYRILCLQHTELMQEDEMACFLNMTNEEFEQTLKGLHEKLQKFDLLFLN